MNKENVAIIYSMDYYSSIKNEIVWFAGKWMEPEITLSEISQTILSHMWSVVLKKEWQKCKKGSVWWWVLAGE
jgi:hypothetical protein